MEIESVSNPEMQRDDEVVEVTSRPPPPQPVPWLIFFPREDNQERQTTFYSLMEEKCYQRNISHTTASKCMALTNGWMLMSEENNGMRCSLINLVKFEEIDLPPPRQSFSESMTSGVLTAPPSNPNSTLVFISKGSPHFICNNVGGDKSWVSKKYSIMENDEENDDVSLESMVVCQEKIYAMSKMGLFAVEFVGNGIVVRSVVPSFPFKLGPGRGWNRGTMEPWNFPVQRRVAFKLVDCSTELFLVVQTYFGLTRHVSGFIVYEMDFAKYEWKKVNNLGQRTFFFSSNNLGCASCFSTGPKVRRNSIYYVNKICDGILRYDMGERSTTMYPLPLPLEDAYDSCVQVGWVKTI